MSTSTSSASSTTSLLSQSQQNQADDPSPDASSTDGLPLHERPVALAVTHPTPIELEMDQYFREPAISRSDNPLTWWQQNCHRLPLLASVARRFLAAPPSSVASERMFSTAGDVLTDSRCRLLPERAEHLIFLKINLPILNFNYCRTNDAVSETESDSGED